MDREWGEVSCKSSKTTRSVRTTCLQVRDGWISHRSCAFIVKIRTSSQGENGSLFFSETTLDAFGIGVSKSPGLRFLGLFCFFFSPWSTWFEANDAGHLEIGHPYVAGKVLSWKFLNQQKPIQVMDVPGWLMEEVLVPRKVTNWYSHPLWMYLYKMAISLPSS